jgi:hypothetical protein
MTLTLQASKLSLYDAETKFNLRQGEADSFFEKLRQDSPGVSEFEQQLLDRTKQQYLYLAERPLLEVTVKMVTLSPLLSLAGFYEPPFYTTLEDSIEVLSLDGSETLRGQLDVLVLQHKIWVVVVEAKTVQYDVMVALPQALTYMIASPASDKELFGMITNGREFRFIRLNQTPQPTYPVQGFLSF